jgi:hypothetical protein
MMQDPQAQLVQMYIEEFLREKGTPGKVYVISRTRSRRNN